jgi:hypothetical protein
MSARREQDAALRLVPLRRRLVDRVPRELVEHERAAVAEQLGDACHVVVQARHVMERTARDHGVEAFVVVHVLQLDPPEDRPFGRRGVDRDDVVACGIDRARELSVAAADLEDPRRKRRKMSEHEVLQRAQASQLTDGFRSAETGTSKAS